MKVTLTDHALPTFRQILATPVGWQATCDPEVALALCIIQRAQRDLRGRGKESRRHRQDAIEFFQSDWYRWLLDFIALHLDVTLADTMLPSGVASELPAAPKNV